MSKKYFEGSNQDYIFCLNPKFSHSKSLKQKKLVHAFSQNRPAVPNPFPEDHSIIQARIAQLDAYQLGTREVLGSNPGKGDNFLIKISKSIYSNLNGDCVECLGR